MNNSGNYSQCPKLTEGDLLYIAGLFDGEGTAFCRPQKGSYILKSGEKKTYNTMNIYARVGMTEIVPVKFLHLCFNGSFWHEDRAKYSGKPHYRQVYTWAVYSKQALAFARQVLPYLKNPDKVAQLQQIVDYYTL